MTHEGEFKTLADYINWRNKVQVKNENLWRPPTVPIMYDKPQTTMFSKLDKDPIIERVLIRPKMPAPRAFPLFGSPTYQFIAGLWTGAMITFIFTCKPLGRREVEQLVLTDPAYGFSKAHA